MTSDSIMSTGIACEKTKDNAGALTNQRTNMHDIMIR